MQYFITKRDSIMKHKLLFFSFLCLATLSCSIALPSENVSTSPALSAEEQQQQAQAEFNIFTQQCANSQSDQINSLSLLLEDVQQSINSNNFPLANKREVVDTINGIRRLLDQMSEQIHLYTNLEDIFLRNHIISALTQLVEEACSKDIALLKTFDINNCITRGLSLINQDQEIDEQFFTELTTTIDSNTKRVEELKKRTDSIGLTWINKAYRAFDVRIIQPGQRWGILSPFCPFLGNVSLAALGTAGIAACAAYILADQTTKFEELKKLYSNEDIKEYKAIIEKTNTALQEDSLSESVRSQHLEELKMAQHALKDASSFTTQSSRFVNYQTRNWFGYRPKSPENTAEAEAFRGWSKDYPPTWIGKLDHALATNQSYFLALCMGATSETSKKLWNKSCAFVDRYAAIAVNKLKGGLHKDTPTGGNLVTPKATFDDLIGFTEIKKILEPLIPFFVNAEAWGKGKRAPELGYLLTGDSRTGKTFTVECLAGSIRAAFTKAGKDPQTFHLFSLTASDLTKFTINEILYDARSYAPCIVFIDEIDLLGLQRTNNSQKLSEFLVALNDCFKADPTKPVVVIAATNRPENLDFALRQQGRLGKEIAFEYPKIKSRYEFLVQKINKVAFDATKFDIERLTLETQGHSFEDINALICNAFIEARILNQPLHQKFVDKAFDRKLRNILLHDDAILSPDEVKVYAAHIAGQILVTELLCNSYKKVAKATILPYMSKTREENLWLTQTKTKQELQPRIKHGKLFTYHLYDTNYPEYSLTMKEQKLQCLLAGFVAEEVLLGVPSSYTYNIDDLAEAREIAFDIEAKGAQRSSMTDQEKACFLKMYGEKARILRESCERNLAQLLKQHRAELDALMKALIEQKTLDSADIKRIMKEAVSTKN